jgi:hypothetical protein
LVGVVTWVLVELCFNVFPATPLSSLVLQVVLASVLIGLATAGEEVVGEGNNNKQR